jgi:phosphatidylinositol kinase/protein kinase (PI-3  family)
VVGVLRSNKDSVMAMLEAFVHDPLINWRLLNAADAGAAPAAAGAAAAAATPPAAAAEPGTSEAGVAAFASTAPVTAFAVAAAAAAAAPPPKVTERRVSSGGLALGPPPMTAVQRRKSSGGLALAGSSVVGALIGSLAGGGGMAAAAAAAEAAAGGAPAAAGVAPAAPSPPQRAARERELKDMLGALGDANEVLNERAVSVMRRMAAKLTGRDGGLPGVTGAGATDGPPDNVEAQVQRLILQATSHENLCQSYIGWCPCAFALRCFACAVVAVLTRAALCAVW